MNDFLDRLGVNGIILPGEGAGYMIDNYFSKDLGWADCRKDIIEFVDKKHRNDLPNEDVSEWTHESSIWYADEIVKAFKKDLTDLIDGKHEQFKQKVNLIESQILDIQKTQDVIQVQINNKVINVAKRDFYKRKFDKSTLAAIICQCYSFHLK